MGFFLMLFLFFSGLLVFCLFHRHFLLTLLSLEYLVLMNYLFLFIFLYFYSLSFYFLFIYLVFSVCEGALGLTILVCVIRSHGNDNLNTSLVLGW
nr:NADH dehydrogenase subunit 4L [Ischnobaenella hainana]